MQGYSLAQITRSLVPDQMQRFFSSAAGLMYLAEHGTPGFDMGTDSRELSWLGGADAVAIQNLVTKIITEEPDAIVVDGELALLPLLRGIASCPLVALANPFDLHNPNHSASIRAIFHSYYSFCDLTLCGTFSPLPSELESLDKVVQMAPFVRENLLSARRAPSKGSVVVVVGGGSHGDAILQQHTGEIIRAVAVCAKELDELYFRIWGDSAYATERISSNVSFAAGTAGCIGDMLTAQALIVRPGRNVLAEALHLGIPTVVILGSGVGVRSAEQANNAAQAQRLSPNIRLWTPSSTQSLADLVRALLRDCSTASAWLPGNERFRQLLASDDN